MAPQAMVDPQTQALLGSLYSSSQESPSNPKPLIRRTIHHIPRTSASHQGSLSSSSSYQVTSWKTAEFAYRKAAEIGIGKDLPTLARGLFTVKEDDHTQQAGPSTCKDGISSPSERIVVRGYDKFFNVGEMSWTKPASIERYSAPPYVLTVKENGCIIFISALSPTQLIVTSKHSLDSQQARQVKEKHSSGTVQHTEGKADEQDDIGGEVEGLSGCSSEMSHAAKGEEWLERHLNIVGKSKADLASELWNRGLTAVAELCDDSFEEHVLAYPPERSGLHLHGLNFNSVAFRTCSMEEVCTFAKTWGFIPIQYFTLKSIEEVKEFTDRVGTTGEWNGEAIEGFVVRTTMPVEKFNEPVVQGTVSPPYSAGQAWFYKVKFDEPYLMYRDWRELTKKMLAEKVKWDEKRSKVLSESSKESPSETPQVSDTTDTPTTSSLPVAGSSGDLDPQTTQTMSKKEFNKAQKQRRKQEASEAAAAKGTVPLPALPKARSNRPETRLFIQWCYDRMYGSADGKVKARPEIFHGINTGKGIIRLRDMFLQYLKSEEGIRKLSDLVDPRGALAARLDRQEVGDTKLYLSDAAEAARTSRPFTHLMIVPIAVPGCGKTSLFLSLKHLYPRIIGHTQSDNVTTSKTGPAFLKNICSELEKHKIVLADRNNHMLQHRDEIVEAVRAWEYRGGMSEEAFKAKEKARGGKSKKKKGDQAATIEVPPPNPEALQYPRVKLVALAWSLDLLPLSTLHHIMSDRILARGDNHQSLVADTTSAAGSRDHETTLWRFFRQLQTLGSAEGKGEGDRGIGDARLDGVIPLQVENSLEDQLVKICSELPRYAPPDLQGELKEPSVCEIREALAAASRYRVEIKKVKKASGKTLQSGETSGEPRYYGIAVEVDLPAVVCSFLDSALANGSPPELVKRGREMLELLKKGERVVTRPHITLVHSSALQPLSAEEEAGLDHARLAERGIAKAKWDRYSSLALQRESTEFDIILGNLVFDERIMAFSISNVQPTIDPKRSTSDRLTHEEFWELQGGKGGKGKGEWRPHITVGTRDESIRPYEGHRVMVEAEEAGQNTKGGNLVLIQGGGEVEVRLRGRLLGINTPSP